MARTRCSGLAGLLLLALAACGPREPGSSPPRAAPTFKPINEKAVVFWDRQTLETADLITAIAAEYNRTYPGLPIKVEYLGDYGDINRKVTVSIQARTLPAMAVGYPNMTSAYMLAGAVVPLDEFIADPDTGLSAEDLADFVPTALESNQYPQFGNQMLSFPFTKSVLMMYFNMRMLRAAGFQGPPKTWDEFLEQSRQVKAKTGKPAYAVNVDCSTIDGMIFSMGGEVVSGNETLFDSPPAIRVFELLETLAREGLAYVITPGSFDDREDFAHDRAAFFFRASSHKPYTELLMGGANNNWGMTMIPQTDPANPRTVLYGGNVTVFKTTPEQQQRAWGFIKYFTSRDVSVRWALGSGYVPIRKSVAEDPRIQEVWSRWEYNRAPFDALAHAHPEPNLANWQEVRKLVERAASSVLAGLKSGRAAALELKKEADAALAAT